MGAVWNDRYMIDIVGDRSSACNFNALFVELVSKELNHLAAILHVYAGGLNFMR